MLNLLQLALAAAAKLVYDAAAGDKKAQKRLKDLLSDESPSAVQKRIEQAAADAKFGPRTAGR
jgi:hypothetical protein